MKKVILAVGLFLTSTTAFADCNKIDQIHGLDNATRQEMKVNCEQKKLDLVNAATSGQVSGLTDKITDPVVLTEWGRVAQEFAKALGIAAQEMGIATNDFLKTPAGKLTAALIIWHVAGESIVGILIALPMLIVLWWICVKAILGLYKAKVTYKEVKVWYGTKRVKESESFEQFDENMAWTFAISMVGCALGTLIIVSNLIY